jgi:predicted ribosomally synthesized peptide with SipW-like signal peptide
MTKKKISIMAIAMVLCLVLVGGAYAYFTDSVTTSASFTAAKVDISKLPANKTFTVGNMAPGVWTSPERLDIYNSGSTIPVKYLITAAANSESVAGFADKIYVRVRHTFAGTPNEGSWPIVYEGKLSNLYINSATTPGVIETSLGVNITHVYAYEFKLAESAGNIYQNANATFTVTFNATQTNNPGWSE